MRIIFISNWSTKNGLSCATVHPHLEQLAEYEVVDSIVYISVETLDRTEGGNLPKKVVHVPFVKRGSSAGLLSNVFNQIAFRKHVLQVARKFEPSIVICRGSQAGFLGYVIWKKFSVSYYVESFEPHAEYMVDSGTWRRWGLKYSVQRRWERKIKRTASRLITVSEGYAKWLINTDKIESDRVRVVPCWVDAERFRFNEEARSRYRDILGVGDSLVCVYLGQFGGLYYDIDAYRAMRIIQDAIDRPMHFLLLTPGDRPSIEQALVQQGLRTSEFSVLYARHADIPCYLSAADFSISFVRSTPSSKFCSPIKYGEYWSCGLPVIASENVGDDSLLFSRDGLGSTVDFFDVDSLRKGAVEVTNILRDPNHREMIRTRGLSKRNKMALTEVYGELVAGSNDLIDD